MILKISTAATLLLVGLLASISADDEIHERLGAEVFLDDSGEVIGVSIPAWHEGFGPDVSIPPDLTRLFDDSRAHPKNDVFNLPLSQAPSDLAALRGLPHLRWVKYCGRTSRIIPIAAIHKLESARLVTLEETLREMNTIKSLAIYDAALPQEVLTQLMKHRSIETILLTGCFTLEEDGTFTRTPDTQIKINHKPEEPSVAQ